jgi:hypothetical protein
VRKKRTFVLTQYGSVIHHTEYVYVCTWMCACVSRYGREGKHSVDSRPGRIQQQKDREREREKERRENSKGEQVSSDDKSMVDTYEIQGQIQDRHPQVPQHTHKHTCIHTHTQREREKEREGEGERERGGRKRERERERERDAHQSTVPAAASMLVTSREISP